MLVHELRELLASADGGQEVRLACQPSWPLQFLVSHTYDSADLEPGRCEDHDRILCEACQFDGEVDLPAPIFWIVQGGNPDNGDSPYDVPVGVWKA